MTGVVEEWKNTFGFIAPDEGGRAALAHFTDILSDDNEFRILYSGQVVVFDLETTPRGPRARNIRVIS